MSSGISMTWFLSEKTSFCKNCPLTLISHQLKIWQEEPHQRGGGGGRDLTSDGDFFSLEGKREGRRDSADTSKRQLTPPFGIRTETGWLSEWTTYITQSVRDCKKVCSSFSCSAVRDPVCTDAMSQTYSEKSKKIRNCRARLVRTKDFASWDSIHIFNSLSF